MAAVSEHDVYWDRTIELINQEFGSDIQSLTKASELLKNLVETKQSLEEQLSFASSAAPSKIEMAVKDAQKITQGIEHLASDYEVLSGDISNHLADTSSMVKKLSSLSCQIQELEQYAKYLQLLAKYEDLSSDIQSALIVNSTGRAVASFSEMSQLTKNIQSTQCKNLLKFANDTLTFWYKLLRDKFSSEFEEVLAAYKWPFIISSAKPTSVSNNAELKDRLGPLFTNLLHLQLPDTLLIEEANIPPFLKTLPGWRPLLLPLQLMLKPLKKRFKYHFYGRRQTNSVDKPEWYFTTVLKWVQDHSNFLSRKIQPLLDKAGLQYLDATTEFSRGLMMLVMEKLSNDLPKAMYDEHIFSHLIDETLIFEKDLRTMYGYPASAPSCLNILTQEKPFAKWILLERTFASSKMDRMLSSDTAWICPFKEISDVDEAKVPECGESFMTLMQTITERYKLLPSVNAKLRFLDLQLELLDEYRIRLRQIEVGTNDPLGQTFCAILNTVNYMCDVLNDWSELVFFLELQYHRQARSKEGTETESEAGVITSGVSTTSSGELDPNLLGSLEGTVFDKTLELLDRMRKEMLKDIIDYVADDVKARSRPYRKEKWMTVSSGKEAGGLGLSLSACEMLLVLKDHLHYVQSQLTLSLFNSFWQGVAAELNKFLFQELILVNHFNEGGAAQLQFDMTRNLFPLFGQYTSKPENYFKDVKEACIVLTLNTGSAMLLKQVLYEALHNPHSEPGPSDPVATLHDIGIYKLAMEDVELVLSRRANLSS